MVSLVRILALFYFFLSFLSQIVARQMIAQGVPGAIVNVSSQASKRALRDHAVYCECVQLQQCPLTSWTPAARKLPVLGSVFHSTSRPGAVQVNISSSALLLKVLQKVLWIC